jgi:hypothetical protein
MTFDPTGSWEQDAGREEFYREKYEREREVTVLKAEIERLKAGRFTEEEFQNLCHNFTCEDRKRFEEGCKTYQEKLFGGSTVLLSPIYL